jgi:hypothetical protein
MTPDVSGHPDLMEALAARTDTSPSGTSLALDQDITGRKHRATPRDA